MIFFNSSSPEHVLEVADVVVTLFKQNYSGNTRDSPPLVLNCTSGGLERSGLLTLGITTIFATQMRKPALLS